MEALDTTVLNTAIPVMASHFGVNPLQLKLALISYLLSLAVFVPISGWLADKFGAKRIFIFAIGFFSFASLLCGFSNGLLSLVIFRLLQGLGGALTLPVARLIVIRTSPRNELVSNMGLVVMVASLGMMLGPLMGGFLTSHLSWRVIFWVNVPVGIFTILGTWRYLPEMPSSRVPRFDILGFILFGTSLLLLTWSFSAMDALSVHLFLCYFIIGIISLGLYALHSRRTKHPVIHSELFRIRTFRIAVLGNLLCRLGFGGIPFLLPLFYQICLKFSPEFSGLLLSPLALGVLTAKPLFPKILKWLRYRYFLLMNTSLVCVTMWLFIAIGENPSFYFLALLTYLYGFLLSMQYGGMNSLAYADIEEEILSSATSIMSMIQQLSQTFGVATAAFLMHFFTEGDPYRLMTIKSFHETFFALGLITLISSFIFIAVKKDDGENLIL